MWPNLVQPRDSERFFVTGPRHLGYPTGIVTFLQPLQVYQLKPGLTNSTPWSSCVSFLGKINQVSHEVQTCSLVIDPAWPTRTFQRSLEKPEQTRNSRRTRTSWASSGQGSSSLFPCEIQLQWRTLQVGRKRRC